jgi:hypothetical protein
MKIQPTAEMFGDMARRLTGYVLYCTQCHLLRHPSEAEFVEFLRKGWPKHCGATMILQSKRERET